MSEGYLYKTTYKPTGLMYFGSRKLPEGVTALEDSYMGSPKGSNKMRELFDTRDESEFTKEVLTVGEYEEIAEMEPLLIQDSWDKWGKEYQGGLVCNLTASRKVFVYTDEVRAKITGRPAGTPMTDKEKLDISKRVSGKGNPMYGVSGKDAPCYGRTGDKHPMFGKNHTPDTIEKMRIANSGSNNGMFGKRGLRGGDSPRAKAVVNTLTGQVWPTITDAARDEGVSNSTISTRISRKSYGGIWKFKEAA